jgi:hypothetical protein
MALERQNPISERFRSKTFSAGLSSSGVCSSSREKDAHPAQKALLFMKKV